MNPNHFILPNSTLLQSTLEAAFDSVAVKDLRGRIQFCNRAWAQALGAASQADVIGKTDFDFLPAALASRLQANEQAVIASGKASSLEEELPHIGAGQTQWFECVRTPLQDPEGKVVALIVARRDITEHKRAQKAWSLAQRLEERVTEEVSERNAEVVKANYEKAQALQLLHALLDNSPDLVYFKDSQSRFLKCSRSVARRVGLETPEEVIGKTDFDFYPKELASEFYQDEQRIIKSGQPIINKIEKKTDKTGQVRWTSATKVPLREKDGRIVGIFGVNRDVTEQRRAEEIQRRAHEELEERVAERTASLSNERRLLKTLIDNLPDAIYAKDTNGRKTLVNPADLKNLNCSSESDAIGKTDFDLFPKEIAAKFWADDQAVINSGTTVINREEYFLDAQGHKRWLLSSKLPLRNEQGEIIGLIGIGRDITSQKESEAKLEAVHKDLVTASRQAGMAEVATGVLHNVGNVLNSLNVSASVMSDKLRASKAEGLSKLAGLLREHSADLGQFLTVDQRGKHVTDYIEQLAGHLERERSDLAAELKSLLEHIGHIKQVITTQQDYARVAGLVEQVSLPHLIDDSFKIHGAAYLRHGIQVIQEYEPVPQIAVDKHRVMQIVVNLLSNAKYACGSCESAEKQVAIRIKMAGSDRVKIEVADNGMGIAPENLVRIFSQGFTTRKDGHGFGLHSGALAAKEIGGSLSVKSDGLGKGATFTLELPLSPPNAKH